MARGKVENGSYVLTWQEAEDRAQLGEGISRPHPKEKTRSFKVRVSPPMGAAMTVWLPAADLETALLYARNRWPSAAVSHFE